jgi:DNA-binding CsgD family transcriptional regulator
LKQVDIVDSIYEAALIPERWPDVLDRLATMAGGVGTILFGASAGNTRWISSPATQAIMERFVAEGWMSRNTRAARLLNHNHPGFITDLDVYTREELDRDAVYTDALRPMGVGWGTATAIPTPNDDLLVFSIERAFDKGPVERERIPPLNAIRPHLARSALLSCRLIFERAKFVVDTLEKIGLPAGVVTSTGKTIAHNDLLASMVPQVRIGAHDRFLISDASAHRLFQQSVAKIDDPSHGGASLPLPALDPNPAAILHLLPLRGDARDVFSRAQGLVLANVVDRKLSPSAEVLQGLFDLTPAEARVARIIAEGLGIKDVSSQLQLSRETVRTQLKAVFAKTGRTSQSSLVALLARL